MIQQLITGYDSRQSFVHFIFYDKSNRKLALIVGIVVAIQFIVFKLLYPYADFFSDSYSYIFAASANLDINIWPIGYSKFLRAIHVLSHSDTLVVAFQYFFLEISSFYFFFTLLYFYKPGKATKLILFIFLFFNPLFLYISNYINSDPLFAALSLCWIGELLWIINRPRLYQLFTQAILLFLVFTVRHNAMYYPFITAVAFVLSRQNIWRRAAGSLIGVALIVPFVFHERNAAYEMYGVKQFSPMSGWLLANNALYMYGHLQIDSTQLPIETRELDRVSRKFYSRLPPEGFSNYLSNYVANFFIRMPNAPLKLYFDSHYQPQSEYETVSAWGKVSVLYGQYGEWLIKHHPIEFAQYFMLLNTKNYFFPPLEKLEIYNLGQDDVSTIAQNWFDYTTPTITSVSKNIQNKILLIFPYLFLFINAIYIGSVIWYFFKRRKLLISREYRATHLLIASFSLANFCFCVFTTIIVLRYQFFPLIVTLAYSLLVVEWLDKNETFPSPALEEVLEKTAQLELAKL